jgi:hypothetical protein
LLAAIDHVSKNFQEKPHGQNDGQIHEYERAEFENHCEASILNNAEVQVQEKQNFKPNEQQKYKPNYFQAVDSEYGTEGEKINNRFQTALLLSNSQSSSTLLHLRLPQSQSVTPVAIAGAAGSYECGRNCSTSQTRPWSRWEA